MVAEIERARALTTPPAGEEKLRKQSLAAINRLRVIAGRNGVGWGDRDDLENAADVIEHLLSSPRVEEVRRMREALLISRGFVVTALEAHPDMKGLDVNDHLVVREIDAALSPQGG